MGLYKSMPLSSQITLVVIIDLEKQDDREHVSCLQCLDTFPHLVLYPTSLGSRCERNPAPPVRTLALNFRFCGTKVHFLMGPIIRIPQGLSEL